MSGIFVSVQCDGETFTAGVLHSTLRRGRVLSTFTYEAAFLARPGAYSLDPALPLRAGGHVVG